MNVALVSLLFVLVEISLLISYVFLWRRGSRIKESFLKKMRHLNHDELLKIISFRLIFNVEEAYMLKEDHDGLEELKKINSSLRALQVALITFIGFFSMLFYVIEQDKALGQIKESQSRTLKK